MSTIDCPCTTFEQDEGCPVGHPSLLCSVCGGKGIAPIGDVVAMAAEMMKTAEQVDELEDPFAAWESIELLKSENERLIAPKQSFTWSDLPGGAKRAIVTELQKARYAFMISDFEVRGMYQVKPDLEAHKALIDTRDAEIERLRDGLSRQGDNMAFVLNHMTIPDQYYRKFTAELEEDRASLPTPSIQAE